MYVRVRLREDDNVLIAEPLFGQSALISTLVQADGVVCIDRHAEGLYAGERVDVLMI